MPTIDQAINRELLTAFGPCNTLADAYATLDAACKKMAASGGGVIVIPNSVNFPDFVARSAFQDLATKAGVLIEDYRGGALRIVVVPEGAGDIYNDVSGGITLERDLAQDVMSQGGGSTLAISNNSRGGVNSINDVITKPAGPGKDVKFYVNSLRGLCPGNWFNITNASNQLTTTQIKALGMDGNEPYFTADTAFAYQAKDRYWHKNWFGAMEIADTHNADDQSGTISVTRRTFGAGDSFGIQTGLFYSSDIMSAGGDEGGIAYSAEVTHDVDGFSGMVESWDPTTGALVYTAADAINTWKLGTSRPIINMNPKKWITAGSVLVPMNGHSLNGLTGPVIGNADTNWDASIIGKFITIDEPSEYYTSDEIKAFTGPTHSPIVRRWFRITGLDGPNSDHLYTLGVETVWFGNYTGGKPVLLNVKNYTTNSSAKKLSYIIAPGAWAIDVRNALGPRKHYVGATPVERTIMLAPFQDPKPAFEPGDPIEQPAGPTPWTPTSYRTRHVHFFPPLMAGHCYVAMNRGPTIVGSGLLVDDGRPWRKLADVQAEQKDGLPSFGTGVTISSPTMQGIVVSGPVLENAILLTQKDGNTKKIHWQGINDKPANIYATPDTGDVVIEPAGNIHLSKRSTIFQHGLSATETPAKNLRDINVHVDANATSLAIKFDQSHKESNGDYAVFVACSWWTATYVENKSDTGFTVRFQTPPANDGTLDWFLVR
jgi:hypothetical protein